MQARTLKNKRLDITEHDIKLSDNSDQILEWKLEIEKDLGEIRLQIDTAKAKAINGDYSDPVWFANVHGAKKVQGLLSQMCQQRLRVLKELKKELEETQSQDRLRWFVEIASQELPEKTFKTLLRKAENAAKKAEEEKSTIHSKTTF